MQRVRGFLWFPGKDGLTIKKTFLRPRIERVELLLFKKIHWYGEEVPAAGVFLEGEMETKHRKKDLVLTLRKQMGFADEIKYYDLSIENEDYVEYVKEGRIEGNYLRLLTLPPFNFEKTKDHAKQIGQLVNASNVLVRSVENQKGEPRLGIDLITKTPLDLAVERIRNAVPSPPREQGEMVLIEGIEPIVKKS